MCFMVVTIKQGLSVLIIAEDELSVSASFLPNKFTDSSVEHNLSVRMGTEAISYTLHNCLSHTGVHCHHQESRE